MIGLLRDGEEIHIDADKYVLEVNLGVEEVKRRKVAFVPVKKVLTSKWLG